MRTFPAVAGRSGLCASLGVCALWLSACTSLSVVPELAPRAAASGALSLPATYAGDPSYLPFGVLPVSNPDAPFRYAYDVAYDRDDVDNLIAIVNPLTLFGFPLGRTRVTAVATLTAVEAGVEAKRYEATAIVSKVRTLYSSDSQTELRAQALAAVRENIEAQIHADADYLRSFLSAAAPGAPASAEVQE